MVDRTARAALFVSLLLVSLALTGACKGREVSEEELAAMATEARETAVRVRGLAAPAAGWREAVASKDEIAAYVAERLRDTDTREQVRQGGRILEDLGALAPGTDLAAAWERTAIDQIAGYYDWEKKTLYLADWLPRMLQQPILVHETTHALQDAHFGLGRFMQPLPGAEDAQAAAQALIEGDATLVMMEALLPPGSGGRELAYAMMIDSAQQQIGQIDAPPVIAEALLFPYTGGLVLARAAHTAGGWAALDRMYADPPLSTEQVLHPRKYLDAPRDLPQRVTLGVPRSLAAAGWREAFRGVHGEFGLRVVLAQGLDRTTAEAATAGWDGDEALLLELAPGGATVTLLASVWDDEAEAREAEAALRRLPVAPRALARDGVRLVGLWGEPVAGAEAAVAEALRDFVAREAAAFRDFVPGP